jgi:hypothetical protein
MFTSKSPVVKVVGYALLGLFVLVIIIAFGMPEFSPMGRDPQVLAIVNGTQIHAQDFLRYRNVMLGGRGTDGSMDRALFTNFIVDELLLQKATKLGFRPSREMLRIQIQHMPELRDRTGAFSQELLNMLLAQNNFTLVQFYKLMRDDTTRNALRDTFSQNIVVSTNEVIALHNASNTRVTVEYTLLTSSDIRQRYANELIVTDDDIDAHIRADRRERQDPQTDRTRISANLERAKYLEIEDRIVSQINDLVENNADFNAIRNTLRGRSGTSRPFGLGEPVIDDSRDVMPLPFASSRTFTDNFMKMQVGESSQAIKTPEGIYVFTVINREAPISLTLEQIEFEREDLYDQTERAVLGAIYRELIEGAKIKRFFGI